MAESALLDEWSRFCLRDDRLNKLRGCKFNEQHLFSFSKIEQKFVKVFFKVTNPIQWSIQLTDVYKFYKKLKFRLMLSLPVSDKKRRLGNQLTATKRLKENRQISLVLLKSLSLSPLLSLIIVRPSYEWLTYSGSVGCSTCSVHCCGRRPGEIVFNDCRKVFYSLELQLAKLLNTIHGRGCIFIRRRQT